MTLKNAIEYSFTLGTKMTRQCGLKQFNCGMEYIQLANWLTQLKNIQAVMADGTLSDKAKLGRIKNILAESAERKTEMIAVSGFES